MATLAELQTLEGHTDRVWNVAWSPAGDMLASCGGDRTVRIWAREAASGRWHCSAILEDCHTRTIRSVCWSPSGRQLATASFDKTTAIWQHQGGVWENIAVLEGHESEVKGVAWSPGGGVIATCSRDKTVWVWEALPGNEYEVLDVKHGHSQDVKRVAWHPAGEVLVSCSYDDTIKLWVDSDDEWICAQTLAGPGVGHDSTVWDLAFDAGGRRMVSCSDDRTLKVWECRKEEGEQRWRLLTTLSGYHDRTIFSVDWSKDGLIATGGADNAIRIFAEAGGSGGGGSGEGGGELREVFLPGEAGSFSLACTQAVAHATDVNCVRWHPAEPGLLASASDDGTVKLWRCTPAPL